MSPKKTGSRNNSYVTLTITSALNHGLDLIQQDKWRAHQRRSIKSGFDRWRAEKYSKLLLWKDLLPLHMREFVLWMERDMKWKRHTVSHYVNPLRKSSEWVQLNFPHEWENIFIRKMRRDPEPTRDRYLMPDQLATAVKFARQMNEPAVVAALMFGGLGGLGIMEILDMKAEDVTSDGVRITRPKNAYRPRVIPMCSALREFAIGWKNCFGHMPIKTDGGISHRARRVLDAAAKATGDKTFSMVNLHQATRVSFANAAKAAGVSDSSLAAYLGHCGDSVLERNYLKLIPRHDDLPRILTAKMQQLQCDVCKPLNLKLKGTVFH